MFSRFPPLLAVIAAALRHHEIAFVEIKAGSAETKAQAVRNFRLNSGIRVFLLNADVDSSGLTLTAASVVFLMEPTFNAALESQAIHRIYRIGQVRKNATRVSFSLSSPLCRVRYRCASALFTVCLWSGP